MIYDHQLPDGTNVLRLTPSAASTPELTPETEVHVVNRGFVTLLRKFDAVEYPLHPHTKGVLKMPYGAAVHFQKHCTVPGSRDVETGTEESFLGILGVDPPEQCEPFTEAECAKFGLAVEAIHREEGEVVAIPVKQTAGGRRQQGGRRPVRQTVGEPIMAPDFETAQDAIDAANNEA